MNGLEANKKFATKLGLTFPLLSDTSKQISKLFGVLNFFRVASRVTFVVDKNGVIQYIDRGAAAADPGFALKAVSQLP